MPTNLVNVAFEHPLAVKIYALHTITNSGESRREKMSEFK